MPGLAYYACYLPLSQVTATLSNLCVMSSMCNGESYTEPVVVCDVLHVRNNNAKF